MLKKNYKYPSLVAFADRGVEIFEIKSNTTQKEIVSSQDITSKIEESTGGFIAEGFASDIIIPKKGSNKIVFQGEFPISIGLPECVKKKQGYLKDGSAAYYDIDKTAIRVAALQENQDGMIFDRNKSKRFLKVVILHNSMNMTMV